MSQHFFQHTTICSNYVHIVASIENMFKIIQWPYCLMNDTK